VPPLITVAGKSKFERCAFKVALPNQPKGCCALYSNVSGIEVDRCWFEGFDQAIELEAGYGTDVRISQTMIVPASGRGLGETQSGELYGWGVKCNFKADLRAPTNGTRSKPNLVLDHCTVEGAGLFDLTRSPGPAPIQLQVNQCAFHAHTLLAFNPNRPQEQQQVHWEGTANQYNILGRVWIVHSRAGSPAFSTDVIDLDSWLHITPDERNTVRRKFKYQVDPDKRPALLRPHDFAIDAEGPLQSRPGANPALVGPWSNP
jgi:hypothetical protein